MIGSATTALITDALAGEPPADWHPTIWMGRWIAAGRHRRRARSSRWSFAEGAAVIASGVVLTATIAALADRILGTTNPRIQPVLRGIALKPALSLKPLIEAASNVQHALESGDTDAARAILGRHLVSRPTAELSDAEVAGAAIESVAENLSDSVVAPLLAFRAGGLAAAYAYRMLNTADAMLGYRTPELEWFGKPAARGDDLANLIPARLTGVLICCAARVGGGSPASALAVMLRDARRTPSPNAGWPMAAMAGALGLRLTKRGLYALHDAGRGPRPADISRACRIVLAVGVVAAVATDLL
jgi:adenosylcobinamide-phosphate synthase